MGLKPACRIEIDGEDIAVRLGQRLLSITVTDNDGEESDTVEIELDDAGYALQEPRRGASIKVFLGWADAPLDEMGQFVVDEVWPEGPPERLIIQGKAADMRGSLKAARSRPWAETTVGAIVETIAVEHGLQPACAPELASRPIAHRDQTNESDLHFLTRLGRDCGAVAAPKGGKLIFSPPGAGRSASGQALTAVVIDRVDLTDWKGVAADREDQGSVRARWRDRAGAQTRFAVAGDGQPQRTLRNTYADEASAQAAADAELARTGRAKNGVELTLAGRPEIGSQTPFTLTGLRPSLNGPWTAGRVEHRWEFSSGGATTSITGSKT